MCVLVVIVFLHSLNAKILIILLLLDNFLVASCLRPSFVIYLELICPSYSFCLLL